MRGLAGVLLLVFAAAGLADDRSDWSAYGRTADEQRFSPLEQINTATVKRLGLAWTQTLQHERGVETTPLVIDGVMYLTGAWSVVYAFDAARGTPLWTFDPAVDRTSAAKACCGVVNRGLAASGGRLYAGTLDGRLVALDAKTGQTLWSAQTLIDTTRPYTITGAPRVVKGKVLIGNGGADMGVRGYVSAYDADTGALAWRFFTVPGDPAKAPENAAMAMAAKTWSGTRFTEWGGGGTVWDAMSWDPELDLLYIGVGNGSPWPRGLRSPGGGDNLFISSIVALRPDTGEYVWHFQLAPGEQWDYPATTQLTLVDLPIEGKLRKLLVQVPKHGFVYVLDRSNGKLLSAEPFTKVTWAKGYDLQTGRPIENPEADYSKSGKPVLLYPGMVGGHNWHPVSFSPSTGYLYFSELQFPSVYAMDSAARFGKGSRYMSTGHDLRPMTTDMSLYAEVQRNTRGSLIAWDIARGKRAWQVEQKVPANGGTLATAGGLVFQGATEGRLVAYADNDGRVLWETPIYSGVPGGPVSYEVDGRQYLAVGVGWGGALGTIFPDGTAVAGLKNPNRIAVYALDAKGVLTPPEPLVRSFDPPPATAPMEQVSRGLLLFAEHCGICHGGGAGGVPDLDYMSAQTHREFAGIVLGGARESKGMPQFREQLDAGGVQAIHDFLIWKANQRKQAMGAPAAAH